MAVTVEEIFNKVGIKEFDTLKWGEIKKHSIPNKPGIYVIALPHEKQELEVDKKVIEDWMKKSENLSVGGEADTPSALIKELKSHWKPNATILYIGQTSTSVKGLKKRLIDFYRHKPGNSGSHSGGYWIKLLSDLDNLHVHYAACDNSYEKEFKMLMYFAMKLAKKESILDIEGLGKYLPFANLTADIDKEHRIKGAVKGKKK